jgi:bacillithiol system protein YtxJ
MLKSKNNKMTWNKIENLTDLEAAISASNHQPIAIFKHSTRCSISSTALDRFERAWQKTDQHQNLKPYLLDLIQFREISNQVADQLEVRHESPQIIIIKEGKAVFHESHYGILLDDILTQL